MVADQRIDGVVAHILNNIIDRFGIHDVAALFVDDLALVIHDIVIFNKLFADIVVARLDLFLRGFDGFRQPFAANRLTVLQRRVHHLRKQGFRSENPQQIIVERQIEARQARVALTPRTTA